MPTTLPPRNRKVEEDAGRKDALTVMLFPVVALALAFMLGSLASRQSASAQESLFVPDVGDI